jgi:hypothetical protein
VVHRAIEFVVQLVTRDLSSPEHGAAAYGKAA